MSRGLAVTTTKAVDLAGPLRSCDLTGSVGGCEVQADSPSPDLQFYGAGGGGHTIRSEIMSGEDRGPLSSNGKVNKHIDAGAAQSVVRELPAPVCAARRRRSNLHDQQRRRLNAKVTGPLPRRIDNCNIRHIQVPAAGGHPPGQAVDSHAPRRHSQLAIELAGENGDSRFVHVGGRRHDQTPPRVELQVRGPELNSEPVEILDRVTERQRVCHRTRLRPAAALPRLHALSRCRTPDGKTDTFDAACRAGDTLVDQARPPGPFPAGSPDHRRGEAIPDCAHEPAGKRVPPFLFGCRA